MTLRRLILEFKPDGIQLRALYRSQGGPRPGTKARRGEVQNLSVEALTAALTALEEGEVEMVGTAGFETREDVLAVEASPLLDRR